MTIGLDSYHVVVQEDIGTVHICASIIWGGIKRNVTAHLTVSDYTAVGECIIVQAVSAFSPLTLYWTWYFSPPAPSDYFVIPNDTAIYFTFTPLDSEECIYIYIIDDKVVEDKEHFIVSLTSFDNCVVVKPTYDEASIYIEDDDRKQNT